MTNTIQVAVQDKIASVLGAPAIICGNSDYSVHFEFDQEWETLDLKTARFVYKKDGGLQFIDVVFSGTMAAVPILSGIDEVYVGVYSGDLHTTTPAKIICKRSILCPDPTPHEEPDPDVYAQILETINNLETLPTVTAFEAGKALVVNEDGHWVVRSADFLYDQNSGKLLKFFFGTLEEWTAWDGEKTNVLFVNTGTTILEEIEQAFNNIENGTTIVGEAAHAATATQADSADRATGDKDGNDITTTYFKALKVNQTLVSETWNVSKAGLYTVNAVYNGNSHWLLVEIRDLTEDSTGPIYIDEYQEYIHAKYNAATQNITALVPGDYGKDAIRRILEY